jgi:hypothetical protein
MCARARAQGRSAGRWCVGMPGLSGLFGLLKMANSTAPRWIVKVRDGGQPATALVLTDPEAVESMRRAGGYKGRDGWIDVDVRVQSMGEPAFEATMKCRLSEAMFGMLTAGTTVNVRYDPAAKDHVLLMDDANALLQKRVIPS